MDALVVIAAAAALSFVAVHVTSVVRRQKRKDAGLPAEPRWRWPMEWGRGFVFGGAIILAISNSFDGLTSAEIVILSVAMFLGAFDIWKCGKITREMDSD